MNGADAVLRSLEAEGVEVVFGIPGGAILPLYDAFARGTTIRHVLARHEQGAGHMAEGYARASGRVGVAVATSGPGATNLVTPIADAWMDSTPLVCITGQVRSHLIGTDAFQECDIVGVTIPIVKHSWLVQDADEIPQVIKAAFHVARTGRCGPVLVDIPRDIQEAELEFDYPDEPDLPGWRPPRRVHPRQVDAAAAALARAEQAGALRRRRRAQRRRLRTSSSSWPRPPGLPVVTTLMAKGAFPETHELFFGWPGMHGPKWSNWAMNKCDLLVAVGARFDDRVTGRLSAFAPGATVVHLDIDSAEIGKLRAADIPVVGPLDGGARGHGRAGCAPRARRRARTPGCASSRSGATSSRLRYSRNGGEMLKPQAVLETLRDLTAGRDDIVWTTGVGQHQMWAMQYLVCDRPRTFVTSGGLGTMGYGLPAAVGAKAARPDATVVCVDGDGCFQMTCQELATAVLEDLPIVVVIVNNGYLGMVQQWQNDVLRRAALARPPDPPGARLRHARRGLRRRRLHRLLRGRARAGARRGARARPHGRRRLPRRPARAVLPDDPGRRGRARPDRVRRATRRWRREAHALGPRREQAGRADADRQHVRAARLQHRDRSRSGRPSATTSRGSRSASTASSIRSSRSRSRCTSSSTCSASRSSRRASRSSASWR